jgi:hypothetical protein
MDKKKEFEDFGELLTPEAAGQFIDRPTTTLANWRTKGEGPPYVRVGGMVRYPYKWLRTWLIENSVCPKGGVCDEQGRGD